MHGQDRSRLDVSLVIELVLILSELLQSVTWLTWLLAVAEHCLGYSDTLKLLVIYIEL